MPPSVAASPKIRTHWNYILSLQRMAHAVISLHPRAKLCRTPAHRLISQFFRTPAMVLAGASRLAESPQTMAQLAAMVELTSAYRSACQGAQQQRRRRVRFRTAAAPAACKRRQRKRRPTPRRHA
jgi:hypothetical protein